MSPPARFIAAAPRWRLGPAFGLGMLGFLVAAGGTVALLKWQLAPGSARVGIGLALASYGAGYLGFLLVLLTPRPLAVEAARGQIAVDGRGSFAPTQAELGVWNTPMHGVAAGTALHLHDGARRFCLGGRDHRPGPTQRLGARPVETVDAYLPAADFDALLAVAGLGSAGLAQAAAPTRVRCTLEPNARWFRRKPRRVIELDLAARRLSVHDAAGAVLASAALSEVTAAPARHNYGGRMSYVMPLLLLRVADLPPLSIGIADFRFSWLGDASRHGVADYLVGGADWLTLVEHTGLAPRLRTA